MAVETVYFSNKDGLTMALKHPNTMLFTTKAEADARDKVLESAEEIGTWLVTHVEGLTEELAEKTAMAIAENRDVFMKGLKKPSLLNATAKPDESP